MVDLNDLHINPFPHKTEIVFRIKSVDSLVSNNGPFIYPVIDAEYADYIADECREKLELFAAGQEIVLVFFSHCAGDEGRSIEVATALRETMQSRLSKLCHERAIMKRMALWSLLIGGIGLAIVSIMWLCIFPIIGHDYLVTLLQAFSEVVLWVSVW